MIPRIDRGLHFQHLQNRSRISNSLFLRGRQLKHHFEEEIIESDLPLIFCTLKLLFGAGVWMGITKSRPALLFGSSNHMTARTISSKAAYLWCFAH